MQSLAHKHIIRLYDVAETASSNILIMEVAEGGDLLQLLKKKKKFTEPEARKFFQQITSALQYTHSRRLVHRDVKAENIFLDANNNVKIGDWGFATEWAPGKVIKTFCGSVHYSAPEICSGRHYTGPEVDVWSTGVLLYMLVTGCFPFSGKSEKDVFERIKEGRVKFPAFVSEGVKDLIRQMLKVDPMQRATLMDAANHPWTLMDDTSSKLFGSSLKASYDKFPTLRSTDKLPILKTIRNSTDKLPILKSLKCSTDKCPPKTCDQPSIKVSTNKCPPPSKEDKSSPLKASTDKCPNQAASTTDSWTYSSLFRKVVDQLKAAKLLPDEF